MKEHDLMTGRVKGRLQQSDGSSALCELFIIEGQASLEMPDGQIMPIGTARSLDFHSRQDFPRKVTLPSGAIFETQETDAFDAMAPKDMVQKAASFQDKLVSALPKVLMVGAAGFFLFKVLTPILIDTAIAMTPTGMVRGLDEVSQSSVDSMFEETTLSPSRQDEILGMFNDLVEARHVHTNHDVEYTLLFREGGDMGANALAMPGGTIVITDELVNLVEEDHIIAAVLAHEIGHVEHQHSLRQMYQTAGLSALMAIVLGGNSEGLGDLVRGGTNVMSLSFSRDHEMESDNYSYDLMKSMGERTDGLIGFFEKMQAEEDLPEVSEWMQTHPLGKNRIRNIERRQKRDGQAS